MIQQLKLNDGAVYEFIEDGEQVSVTGAKCGMNFGEVLRIFEPYSSNPCIQIPKPLGYTGMLLILKSWDYYLEDLKSCSKTGRLIEEDEDESTRKCNDCGCEAASYEFERFAGQDRCPECNSCEISAPAE
jgi:predicted Zn-ribbon and HTH transcriptional regulator